MSGRNQRDKMKIVRVPIVAAALMSACPAIAGDLAPADRAMLQRQIDKVVTALKAGGSEKAVSGFFASSKMLKPDDATLVNLRKGLTSAFSIYGRVTACAPAGWNSYSAIVVSHQMVCAHEKYATRWKLTFAKLSDGWSAIAFKFDDKITDGGF